VLDMRNAADLESNRILWRGNAWAAYQSNDTNGLQINVPNPVSASFKKLIPGLNCADSVIFDSNNAIITIILPGINAMLVIACWFLLILGSSRRCPIVGSPLLIRRLNYQFAEYKLQQLTNTQCHQFHDFLSMVL